MRRLGLAGFMLPFSLAILPPASSGQTVSFSGTTFCDSVFDSDGFDSTSTPRWLSVKTGSDDGTKATIAPKAAAAAVTFDTSNEKARVKVTAAAGAEKLLEVHGRQHGFSRVRGKDKAGNLLNDQLGVAVYDGRTPLSVRVYIATPKDCPKPTNAPADKGTLQRALNAIWDQAVVRFTVESVREIEVNFDKAKVDYKKCALDALERGESAEEEILFKDRRPADTGTKINIFYVKTYRLHGHPNAAAAEAGRIIVVGDKHDNTTGNVTAHEVGHSLGLGHASPNNQLMHGVGLATSGANGGKGGGGPCLLLNGEWDTAHAKASTL